MAGKPKEREAKGTILGSGAQAELTRRGVEVESVFTPSPMQIRMLQRLEKEVFAAGGKFGGKGAPLTGKVLTPDGWVTMGSLRIGSIISSPSGGTTTVAGIYPLGEREIFRVTCSDGAATLATEDHLWLTQTHQQQRRGNWSVKTTARVKKTLKTNRGTHNNHRLPLTKPVEFTRVDLPIPPYTLGCLLADGCITTPDRVVLTSGDQEIPERVGAELLAGYAIKRQPSSPINYFLKKAQRLGMPATNRYIVALKELGLFGHGALDKFIPKQYLFASPQDRLALLQGLMDCDGCASKGAAAKYTTISPALRDGVVDLVRSLGGVASWRLSGGRIFDINVCVPVGMQPFSLSRKAQRYSSKPKRTTRTIASIESVGREQAQCIKVAAEDQLYICDDFIVTHNSFGAIFWMVKGNVELPDYDDSGEPILVNMSYVHHPHYLGVVIRLNEKDLAEWVDKARPYYEDVLGGVYTKNPSEFRWQSGARIFLGHAQDSNAWTKYQGQNIIRFLIEEAGQIPDLDTYDQLRSCCRSVYPEMREQLLLTANPGGRGQQWLFDRFIEPKDRKGVPVKHPLYDRPIVDSDGGLIPIVETVKHPYSNEQISTDRVWVPSLPSDNPHAMSSTSYLATLATMSNEKLKRAYLYGDWKALQGTYFDNFHRDTHTYDPATRPLPSWWKATASLDWGFVHESAAYWHKKDPETKQNLIYKEFVTTRTDPVELGAELARQSRSELLAQGTLIFYVSHDLYHERIGDFTWIELIAKGVTKELGQGTCYMPEIVIKRLQESYRIEGKQWDESIEDRIISKRVTGIVFRRAPKAKAVGFMHVRSLMRMEPLIKIDEAKPNLELAYRIAAEGSIGDYAAYLNSFKREMEILPELLISRECKRLIDAIPKPIHSDDNPDTVDDKHFLGKDSIDSMVYLLSGIRDEKPSAMPRELERLRLLDEAHRRNPQLTTADMIWISRGIEEREAEQDAASDGFSMGRASRALRYGGSLQ